MYSLRLTLILLVLAHIVGAAVVAGGVTEEWVISSHGMEVPFKMWRAEEAKGAGTNTGVLVLVPGYNGNGEQMLDERWKTFAEKNGWVLLAPTFQAKGNENNEGKGYYYPEQGSGEVVEKALREVKRRTGVETEQVMFFGFSAGAHFSHRFALWKPKRVKAFVAYSAGWWSEPTAKLKKVPALVMCGEADERYGATFEFFKKGQRLGCPWVWRSYDGTGHELTPMVRTMAEAFLAHYAGSEKQVGIPVPSYGDIQTFKTVSRADRESIPEEFRIELPSEEMVDVWEKEKE